MPSLSPDQVQKIHEYIHNQQLIHAIKLYREATGVGLAEAKDAVEAMARGEAVKPPSGTMDYDNPILEARIKSLLARRLKIEAVKIYREEYGTSLKKAKDAVDRIEATMSQDYSSMSLSNQSAFGSDPFAEVPGDRRRTIVMAVGIAVLLLGMAVFFLTLNP